MSAIEQIRGISLKFRADLKEKDGVLAPLTKMLKEKENKLVVCFRTNYINIYYKCGSMYKISEQKNFYKIEFNFGYAGKTKEKKEKELEEIGFKKVLKKVKNKKVEYLVTKIPRKEQDFAEKFFKTSMPILKTFMDNYECGLEEKQKFEIFLANKNPNSNFFIYDVEYQQPRENKNEKHKGRFDLLAIKKVGKNRVLVFCELKSTKKACIGKNGVVKHFTDLNNYLTGTNSEKYINARKEEASLVYKNICCLFGEEKEKFEIDSKPEILFIYTDEAKEYEKKQKGIILEEPFEINF